MRGVKRRAEPLVSAVGQEGRRGCSVPIQVRCAVNTPLLPALQQEPSVPPSLPLSPPCKPDKSLWRHSRAPTHSAASRNSRDTQTFNQLSPEIYWPYKSQSCQFISHSSLSLPPFFPSSPPLFFRSPIAFLQLPLRLLLWQLH